MSAASPFAFAALLAAQAPAPAEGSEKVEEVDFDAEEKASARPAGTTIEEVKPEELAQKIPLPEYETNRWLLLGPLICLLAIIWNVDWREQRVKSEVAAARQKRAPPVKKVSE